MHDEREPAPAIDLLVQSVMDYGIFMLDPRGRIESWNTGAQRIKGYSAEEVRGRHFSLFYPPEDIAAGKPERELTVAVAQGRMEDEGWRVRKDGTRFWANVVITALFDESGGLRGFGKVTRDMTERREAEQALRDRRRLLSHMVDAQETERRRIAWDVHDDSIQSMVAVSMRLQLLAGRLPPEHAGQLRKLEDAAQESIRRLRSLVSRLRPTEIDRQGLGNALQDYLGEVVAGWDLTCSYRDELQREPPGETAVTAFRICQEALTNVHKHAGASDVEIVLSTVADGIQVTVHDNGVGIDVRRALAPSQDHFGLLEMRERAETADGWWTIRNEPGGGTTVEFWLPVPVPATEVGSP